jgi:hypothetical protein
MEAARFANTQDPEITDAERQRVKDLLTGVWQRRYGLVEAG